MDNKGHNILVDENLNVIGIIDWEWAHTSPLAHTLNSPIGLTHVRDVYDGVTDLRDDDIAFAR